MEGKAVAAPLAGYRYDSPSDRGGHGRGDSSICFTKYIHVVPPLGSLLFSCCDWFNLRSNCTTFALATFKLVAVLVLGYSNSVVCHRHTYH